MASLYPSRDVRYVADNDGSILLLHMRTGKYTFLNRTAGRVWRHMVEHRTTVEDALVAVAPGLGASADRFMADMVPVVAAWRKCRIITEKELKQ